MLDGFRQIDAALVLRGYDASPVALHRARARGLAVEALDIVALSAEAAAGLARQVAGFDLAVCLGFGYLGFRLMRVSQMVIRYGWINERAGLLRWRRRDDASAGNGPESG